MAVNLNGIDLGGAATSSTRKTSPGADAATASPEATQQSESEVSITSTAALLSHLQQALANRPAVDESRVAAISRAMAQGTYAIQPGKIADGLIQSERDLARLRPLKSER